MTPVVGGAELVRHPNRPNDCAIEQWMFVDAAVNDTDNGSILGDVVELRQVGDREFKSFPGSSVGFRRQIDSRDVFYRQQRLNYAAGHASAEHCDRRTDIAVEDLTAVGINILGDLLQLPCAKIAPANVPQFQVEN